MVFESASRHACSERGLVLQSLGISYEMFDADGTFRLVVPAEEFEKAKFELWQYEQENRPAKPIRPLLTPVYQNAIPGVLAYILIISVVALLAGEAFMDRNWFASGRVDGVLIRNGEWWRSITALTLHSSFKHYAGNAGFGAVFGLMAGRLLGPGVTWFAVVVTGATANLLNTLLLDSTHRSIGASTAVFAVLGIVAGFVWRAKLMKQDRWAYRLGPVVGGLALLAYTGTGDANTDIGAHVLGFACGFVGGIVLTRYYELICKRRTQRYAGALALASIFLAWTIALG